MSLRTSGSGRVPETTRRIAEAALPQGSPAIRVRDALGELFRDEDFADLFPQRGRPALSPAVLALVSILQFAEGLSDRQAALAVRARIDWKYALGLELEDPGFDHSVLSEFRDRLVEGSAETRITDAVLAAASEAGLLKSRGRQRTDSTHVLAVVRGLNRLELAGETLRAALNALAAAAPQWLTELADDEWFKRYSYRVEDYRLPQTKTERIERGNEIGKDGMRLLQAVHHPTTPEWIRQVPAVEMLRRTWIQEFQIEDETVTWRHPKNIPPAGQRLVSPYDSVARSGSKRDTDWQGWKVHITETCEPDQPNLITHVLTTTAPVHDVQVTDIIHGGLAEQNLLPTEHFVDSGYTEARVLVSAQRDYGIEIVGPVQGTAAWQAKDGDGFTQENFTIDWQAQEVSCPNGKRSRGWSDSTSQTGAAVIRVWFSINDCGPCPVRSQCTRGTGRIGRRLTFRNREELEALRKAREEQKTDEWRRRYQTRAGIESTISQGVRQMGLRRSRYHGAAKTHLQHQFTAAALNLSRIDAWITETPRGSSRTSHFRRLRPVSNPLTKDHRADIPDSVSP
ncbi:IS1182 family transposase [Streptomyces anulatus]|uniref:IS1182 family transposase n=1 Tax=Streptomyces anulatus TaxID=1892 RepID=UPI00225B8A76|nr:IS1182 family transposase [Streptomyces anulatus]MCX4482387.1 IS1182 family transposase [Streptomyces anulatus]